VLLISVTISKAVVVVLKMSSELNRKACGWILDYPEPSEYSNVSLDNLPSYGSLPSSWHGGPGRRFIAHLSVRTRWEEQTLRQDSTTPVRFH